MALMYCLTAMLSIISHVIIRRTRAHTLTRAHMHGYLVLNQSLCVVLLCLYMWVCERVSLDEHFYQCYRITHIHHRLNMHLIMTFYSSGTNSYVYILFACISPYIILYIIHMLVLMRIRLFICTAVFHPSTNQNMST